MTPSPGKQIAKRLYLHVSALDEVDDGLPARVAAAECLAGLTRGEDHNLVRLDLDGPAVALLHYPDFFDSPFPALAASWLVDVQAGTVSYRTYADSLNPPILHRKELMLSVGSGVVGAGHRGGGLGPVLWPGPTHWPSGHR